jgi:hypothetical protein
LHLGLVLLKKCKPIFGIGTECNPENVRIKYDKNGQVHALINKKIRNFVCGMKIMVRWLPFSSYVEKSKLQFLTMYWL